MHDLPCTDGDRLFSCNSTGAQSHFYLSRFILSHHFTVGQILMMLNYYDITCKFHELVVIAIILNFDNLLNDCIYLQHHGLAKF